MKIATECECGTGRIHWTATDRFAKFCTDCGKKFPVEVTGNNCSVRIGDVDKNMTFGVNQDGLILSISERHDRGPNLHYETLTRQLSPSDVLLLRGECNKVLENETT